MHLVSTSAVLAACLIGFGICRDHADAASSITCTEVNVLLPATGDNTTVAGKNAQVLDECYGCEFMAGDTAQSPWIIEAAVAVGYPDGECSGFQPPDCQEAPCHRAGVTLVIVSQAANPGTIYLGIPGQPNIPRPSVDPGKGTDHTFSDDAERLLCGIEHSHTVYEIWDHPTSTNPTHYLGNITIWCTDCPTQ